MKEKLLIRLHLKMCIRDSVPTYNQNTLDELGNFHPDFTGGFNTSISFKNCRLSANIDFSVGGQIVSYLSLIHILRKNWNSYFGKYTGPLL